MTPTVTQQPTAKGGSGSGNWAHAGRPGIRGGSTKYSGGLAYLGLSNSSSHELRQRTSKVARQMRLDRAATDKAEREFWANADQGGLSPLDRIKPTGRAPKGQGAEFAERRRIANRIDGLRTTRSRLNLILQNDRGVKAHRRRKANAKARIGLIDETLGMVEAIAGGLLEAEIPFSDSRDLFDDVFSYTSSIYGGGA